MLLALESAPFNLTTIKEISMVFVGRNNRKPFRNTDNMAGR